MGSEITRRVGMGRGTGTHADGAICLVSFDGF